jgi:hypothetical protein
MDAIKKTRKFIEENPHLDSAKALACLVRALESEDKFEFGELYKFGYEQFNLGIDILKEWRIDRYYMGRTKIHDLTVHFDEPPSRAQLDALFEHPKRGKICTKPTGATGVVTDPCNAVS